MNKDNLEIQDDVKENSEAPDDKSTENEPNSKKDSEECNDESLQIKEELDELNDQYLRLNAEFQNYKKRTEKEKAKFLKFANENLVLDILPVLDNFERALDNVDKDSAIFEGVELIQKQLIDVLKNNGVIEIESDGDKFNPELHHAVLTEKVDGVASDIILQTLQKGYFLNDRVIRPSMVKVSKGDDLDE